VTSAPEAGEYIAWLEQQNLTDPVHKGMLREMKKSYERLVKIPADRFVAFSRLTSEAQAVWAESRRRNDYEMFKPYLKQIMDFEKNLSVTWDTNRTNTTHCWINMSQR